MRKQISIAILILILNLFPDNFGRERDYSFFKKEYGKNPLLVCINLTNIRFYNKKFKIHKKVYKSLSNVIEKSRQYPEIGKFVSNIDIHSYNWRYIKEETNLSPHSFGIAIDFFPTNFSGLIAYWKWTPEEIRTNKELRWTPPKKLIELLKNNHFIWGGDWDKFDTIHFEYRIELK